MSTQIRRCNLLRLIGVYTPRGKKQFSSKQLSKFISMLVNNVYPDQTPKIVAPNRSLPPRGKPTVLSKTIIQIYLHVGRQRIMCTQIRRRNLLRLIRVYTPRGKPTILSKTAIQFYLCLGRLPRSGAAICCA